MLHNLDVEELGKRKDRLACMRRRSSFAHKEAFCKEMVLIQQLHGGPLTKCR